MWYIYSKKNRKENKLEYGLKSNRNTRKVLLMKYQWLNKNIDLSILRKGIERYFKARKFRVRSSQLEDAFEVFALKRVNHIIRKVKVRLYGAPDNFTVEFLAGKQIDPIQKADLSLELFGGGIFVLKAYEALEFYQKLERDFWKYMEVLVAELVGSGDNSLTSHS